MSLPFPIDGAARRRVSRDHGTSSFKPAPRRAPRRRRGRYRSEASALCASVMISSGLLASNF
ncbi:MAG TPA: hypothetical protein VKA16_01760, partial [Burkholderiales bacterium]|nr:hypothetical protein [Burkholderiales bacterium]